MKSAENQLTIMLLLVTLLFSILLIPTYIRFIYLESKKFNDRTAGNSHLFQWARRAMNFSNLNPSTMFLCFHFFFLGCYEIKSEVSCEPYIEVIYTYLVEINNFSMNCHFSCIYLDFVVFIIFY